MRDDLKAALGEGIASAFLLIAVVGSGIAAQCLSGGNAGLELLVNAVVTGCALVPLILSFGPISGAHMNPVVTLLAAAQSRLPWRRVPAYLAAQCAGALAGVAIAHVMFTVPILQVSQHERNGTALWVGEIVATVGLLGTILRCQALGLQTTAAAVALYITGAYWFTSSTSFANPAVTLARAFTDTFSGIAPADAPAFMAAQFIGLGLILLACRVVPAPKGVS